MPYTTVLLGLFNTAIFVRFSMKILIIMHHLGAVKPRLCKLVIKVCVHVCMCLCVCACICTHAYVYACTPIHAYVCMHTQREWN